ncbi:MAG: FKBP-type peptidyl-prolyl cis-trans isomerase [Bacteroidota bacterium]
MEAKNHIFLRIRFLVIFSLILFVFLSCNESKERPETKQTIGMMNDSLIQYNQRIVQEESREIEDFIDRYQWKMSTTTTGLRYMIYTTGKGASAKKGELARINYSVRLLNGDLVYKSDSLAPFEFEIGKRRVPNGLEEGVILMKPGERAKLVVPSYLAFGLAGDQDRVPPRAILVYDIELLGVKRANK